jgi:hypothetical protein
MHREECSLLILRSVEHYVQWWSTDHSEHLHAGTTEFEWMCLQAESIDSATSTALRLTPEFREIPGCVSLIGCCSRQLFDQLECLQMAAEEGEWFDEFQSHKLGVALRQMEAAAEMYEAEED